QLPGNQDHLKVELENLKKAHEEQQQKLEERVWALQKELQEAQGAAGASRHRLAEQSAVSRGPGASSRAQGSLTEGPWPGRSPWISLSVHLQDYMDSKPGSAAGHSKAPAGRAAMRNFVDSVLREIRASYKSREEQLARAARGYKKRLKDLARKHENLLIAYGLQREQILALGSSAVDCGPAELHFSITDPELQAKGARELNRLREEKAKLEMQLQQLQR
ncbi:CCD78 protein, partial [Spelaeornis formosus]|nr:CCD78 protein [Elachura formosa]